MQSEALENQPDIQFKKTLLVQVLLGIGFGLLNHLVYFLQSFNPVPLYMDTLFTVTASFFGAVSGVIAAALYHILYLFFYMVNHNIYTT